MPRSGRRAASCVIRMISRRRWAAAARACAWSARRASLSGRCARRARRPARPSATPRSTSSATQRAAPHRDPDPRHGHGTSSTWAERDMFDPAPTRAHRGLPRLSSPRDAGAHGRRGVRAWRRSLYVNAGTVEFLSTRERRFHLLDMNTRLQVDIRYRAGHGSRSGQGAAPDRRRDNSASPDDVSPTTGRAIQCRINAEDPHAGFIPSPGRITSLRPARALGARRFGVYGG